jgi:hypothetical protein
VPPEDFFCESRLAGAPVEGDRPQGHSEALL